MTDPPIKVFKGLDGAKLAYRAHNVPTPIGSLVFVHGLGDHSGWFEPLAAAANARGLDWYGLDLRGHGNSAGKRGHVESFVDLLRDVHRLRKMVANAHARASAEHTGAPAGHPIVVGGHSLGGLVALRYAQERPDLLAGVLLVAPFLAVAARVPAWKRIAARLANRLIPRLTLDNGLVRADLISDEDAIVAYESDPLMHRRISARLWAEILEEHQRARNPAELPALFQLAGDDRAVQTAVAQRLCETWEYPSDCVVYPGARHDLYHDRVAERALADAVDWVTASVTGQEATESAAAGVRSRRLSGNSEIDSKRLQRDEMKTPDSHDEGVPPETDAAVEDGAAGITADEISAEIREELSELDELRDRHLRTAAEFENYRKRTRRELSEARQMGQGDIAVALLEVLDDLSRFATIPVAQTTVDALHEGVELVNRKLRKQLEDAGLRRVDASDGVVFNPTIHEAVLTANVDDPALDDRISRVFSPGYLFGERLLRPAQVEVQQHKDGGGLPQASPETEAGADSEA